MYESPDFIVYNEDDLNIMILNFNCGGQGSIGSSCTSTNLGNSCDGGGSVGTSCTGQGATGTSCTGGATGQTCSGDSVGTKCNFGATGTSGS